MKMNLLFLLVSILWGSGAVLGQISFTEQCRASSIPQKNIDLYTQLLKKYGFPEEEEGFSIKGSPAHLKLLRRHDSALVRGRVPNINGLKTLLFFAKNKADPRNPAVMRMVALYKSQRGKVFVRPMLSHNESLYIQDKDLLEVKKFDFKVALIPKDSTQGWDVIMILAKELQCPGDYRHKDNARIKSLKLSFSGEYHARLLFRILNYSSRGLVLPYRYEDVYEASSCVGALDIATLGLTKFFRDFTGFQYRSRAKAGELNWSSDKMLMLNRNRQQISLKHICENLQSHLSEEELEFFLSDEENVAAIISTYLPD